MGYTIFFLLLSFVTSDPILDYSELGWVDTCKGKKNSPIDIPKQVTNTSDFIKIVSKSYPLLKGVNWEILNSKEFYLNLTSLNGYLMIMKNNTNYKYLLDSIKLHIPSEHSIQGQKYDVEIQIFHTKDAIWLTNSGVVTDPDLNYKYLAISVFFKSGSNDTNQIMTGFDFSNFGNQLSGVDISIFADSSSNFFHYEGSQTTPNCDENVNWIILENIQNHTKTQNDIVSSIVKKIYPYGNARSQKNLNTRTVYYLDMSSASDNLNFSMIILAMAVMFLIFFFRKKFDII